MTESHERVIYLHEVAEFLATRPAVEDVLAFHPSAEVEARFGELLECQRVGTLIAENQEELNRFRQTEMLVRLLKARLRKRTLNSVSAEEQLT